MPGFKTGNGSHSRYFLSETSRNPCGPDNSCITDGCLTPYDTVSLCNGHNRGDDTELQARSIWTNTR